MRPSAGAFWVRSGPSRGARIPLPDGEPLTLGRDPKADLFFNDEGVAPLHAELTRRGRTLHVRSLTDGRFLPEEGSGTSVLHNGQRITFGAILLEWSAPQIRRAPLALAGAGLLIAIGWILEGRLPEAGPSRRPTAPSAERRRGRAQGAREASPSETTPIEEARRALELGIRRFEDRRLSPEGLWLALQSFEQARRAGARVQPPPSFLPEIQRRLDEAQALLDREFRSLQFSAVQSLRLDDRAAARRAAEQVAKRIPDPSDDRRRWAEHLLRRLAPDRPR